MKSHLTMFLAATASLALSGCGADGGKSFDAIPAPSRADTMIYYYGQLRAEDYWQAAEFDSLMRDDAEREEFLKGLKEGLMVVKKKKDSYNQGVKMGVSMALSIERFNRNYNIDCSRHIAYDGFAYGLINDTIVNTELARKYFYGNLSKYRDVAENNNRVIGARHLREEAAMLRMSRISENLWGKPIVNGTTPLKNGEAIKVDIHLVNLKGRDIDIPFPQTVEVGNRFVIPVISDAVATMRIGGKSRFATTAEALIGSRCEQLQLEPSEVILFTIQILPS